MKTPLRTARKRIIAKEPSICQVKNDTVTGVMFCRTNMTEIIPSAIPRIRKIIIGVLSHTGDDGVGELKNKIED